MRVCPSVYLCAHCLSFRVQGGSDPHSRTYTPDFDSGAGSSRFKQRDIERDRDEDTDDSSEDDDAVIDLDE